MAAPEKCGLKIWRNFFSSKEMIDMQTTQNGTDLILILLKLYDFSLDEGGKIKIENVKTGEGCAGYLAKLCRVDGPLMERALRYFVKNKIVNVVNKQDGIVLEFPYVRENII